MIVTKMIFFFSIKMYGILLCELGIVVAFADDGKVLMQPVVFGKVGEEVYALLYIRSRLSMMVTR